MRRLMFAAAALAILALPAGSAEAPGTPRYEVAASADGFIRLDTATGATSHCTRTNGVWRCEPVLPAGGASEAEIAAIATEVDALSAVVADTNARIDALAARIEAGAGPVADTGERSFFAQALDRLFAAVRFLKHGRDAEV